MEGKRLILLISLTFILNTCRKDSIIINSNFISDFDKVKEIAGSYIDIYSDIKDLALIVIFKNDTTSVYVNNYSSKKIVGDNEPFGVFSLKGRNVYIFFHQGFKFNADPSLKVKKPEIKIDDYPIWLIHVTNSSVFVQKGVRGKYSPKPPPEGFEPVYVPPVVDTSLTKNPGKNVQTNYRSRRVRYKPVF